MLCFPKLISHFPMPLFRLPGATFPSSRVQNRDFCALFAFGTLVFGLFEHKIGIFVSERAIFPWFLPLPSTKSGFLCAYSRKYGLWKQKSAQIFVFARF